ncbi:HAD family hydrolase [Shimia ponticola]|uniref:HAD family hydrolase n=1 Tax=Shimia ponticola TaxID=2582893 RepID=UPI003D287206
MDRLTTLAFDADDTLWHNETFFQLTQERFVELLSPHNDAEDLQARLLETEKRNIGRYGFGVKGFTLSMIETALEVTNGQVPGAVIQEILANGRDLLAHPVELLPGVKETLTEVSEQHRLTLVTKGDLLHQEEKLAASGLGDLFSDVHIVSQKEPATYRRIFETPDRVMMVGNSMKSDILPVLEVGGWATFVPFHIEWELERADTPNNHPRFRQISTIRELPDLLRGSA